MRLKDIMTRGVKTASRDDSAQEAWQRMRLARIEHLVVLDDGRVVGILSDRDLGGPRGTSIRRGARVGELMSGRVVTARPETTVREAANLLRGRSIGCLPVLERGRLVGIVTTSDLLELLGRGAERPIERSVRWTLRERGPRHAGRA